MPKGMGYGTKYEAKGAKVMKHGGNKAIHDGVVSSGPNYPKPDAGASKMAKGMTGGARIPKGM